MTITDGLVYTEERTKAKRNTILIIIQLRDIIISSRPFHLSYYGHGHLGGIVATASRPLLSLTQPFSASASQCTRIIHTIMSGRTAVIVSSLSQPRIPIYPSGK